MITRRRRARTGLQMAEKRRRRLTFFPRGEHVPAVECLVAQTGGQVEGARCVGSGRSFGELGVEWRCPVRAGAAGGAARQCAGPPSAARHPGHGRRRHASAVRDDRAGCCRGSASVQLLRADWANIRSPTTNLKRTHKKQAITITTKTLESGDQRSLT